MLHDPQSRGSQRVIPARNLEYTERGDVGTADEPRKTKPDLELKDELRKLRGTQSDLDHKTGGFC